MPSPPNCQTSPTLYCLRRPSVSGGACLVLLGELEVTTAERARVAIRGAHEDAGAVTCDLAYLTYVDVSGMCVLLDAAARARHHGERLTLERCPSIVAAVFRLFGLEEHIEQGTSSACAAAKPSGGSDRRTSGRREAAAASTRRSSGHVDAARQAGRRRPH